MDIKTLAIICLLLVSMGTAHGDDSVEVKITNPSNGTMVLKTVEVELTSKNISAGQNLWICVYPINTKRYYIQDKRYLGTTETMGHLYTKAFVGIDDDNWDSEFKLLAVIADRDADEAIIEYLTKYNAKGSWLGLEKLPDGAVIYDTINVIRV